MGSGAVGLLWGVAGPTEVGIGFGPVRKEGKLPGSTHSETYDLEYGSAVIEIHADALARGTRTLVIDDILATGGTAAATCELIERAGASVEAVEVLVELGFLGGRNKLGSRTVHAMLSVAGP